jgi:hypothetical protein
MKTPLLALALTSLGLVLPASAVEYVTLTKAHASRAVSTTDLVEVVGTTLNNNGDVYGLQFTFPGSPAENIIMNLRGKESAAFDDMKGNTFVGANNVQLLIANGQTPIAVTIKITPAQEISVASEGTVLVVPDSSTGDLTVIVESSDDMVAWSTFLSQTITAGSDPKFYRTRIIKNVSP